jgi:hypothetical protein
MGKKAGCNSLYIQGQEAGCIFCYIEGKEAVSILFVLGDRRRMLPQVEVYYLGIYP